MTIKSNTIAEFTAGAGVTIDGVLLKDGTISGSTLGTYNVMTYGATGDGSTNDTAAIQAAINACAAAGGGQVYLPTGKYKLTQTGVSAGGQRYALLLPSHVALCGGGATATEFQVTGVVNATESTHYAAVLIEGTSLGTAKVQVTVRDLAITGTNSGAVASSYYGNAGVYVFGTYTENITISNCILSNFYSSGIKIFTDQGGPYFVSHNTCRNNGETGINCNASYLTLDNNACYGNAVGGIEAACSKSTISNNICIDNDVCGIGLGGFTSISGDLGKFNLVSSNICSKNGIDGLRISGGTQFSVFANNACTCNGSMGINISEVDAPTVTTHYNTIQGNLCASNGDGTGGHNYIGLYCTADYNIMTGNVCLDTGESGYAQGLGIALSGSDHSVVWGNICYSNTNQNYNLVSSSGVRFQAPGLGGAGSSEVYTSSMTFAGKSNFIYVYDAAYTLVGSEDVIGFASLSTNRVMTLPAVANVPSWRPYIIKDINGAMSVSHTLTITPTAATIDGASTLVLSTAWGKCTIMCDGTNWITV